MNGFWRPSGTAMVLLFLAYTYYFQIYPNLISTNEVSRFLLTSAIVDYGSIRIDQPIQRFGDTVDKASFNGFSYSDKAIGLSLLAVPPYMLLKAICASLGIALSRSGILFYLRVVCVTIPALIFIPLLVRFWQEIRTDRKTLVSAEFIFLFGTISFTYSVMFVSNSLAGVMLFASFYALYRAKHSPVDCGRYLLLGGGLAGFAILLEYPAVLPALFLGLYAAWTTPSRIKWIWFGAGCSVFLAILLGYNYAIFGTPFDVTYHHMANASHANELARGFFGLSFPDPYVLFRILFGSDRGLFLFCPVLLLCFPGFVYFFRRREWRNEATLFLAIIAGTILLVSGMGNWNAGWAFGPRYLALIIPFMMTAVFVCLNEPRLCASRVFQWVWGTLAMLSWMIVIAGTTTFPGLFPEVRDPIPHLTIPLFLRGDFTRNLGEGLGLTPHGSFLLFITIVALAWIAHIAPEARLKIQGTAIMKWVLILLVSAGLLAIKFKSSPESAVDAYFRGYACFFLGDYKNAISDLKKAWDSTNDPNFRNTIAREALHFQSRMPKKPPE